MSLILSALDTGQAGRQAAVRRKAAFKRISFNRDVCVSVWSANSCVPVHFFLKLCSVYDLMKHNYNNKEYFLLIYSNPGILDFKILFTSAVLTLSSPCTLSLLSLSLISTLDGDLRIAIWLMFYMDDIYAGK